MTNILVVGAGIAGPAVAIALHRVGLAATIVERRPEPSYGAGAFLTLGSNGLAAATTLGVGAAVTGLGFATPELTMVSGTGAVLGNATVSAPDPVSRTMRRSDLGHALREAALAQGIPIVDGADLVGVAPEGKGVTARFADGTIRHADLVVGCDGVRSRVRRAIAPDAEPRWTGLVGYGGFSPAGLVTDPPGSYRMVFGRRAFFGHGTSTDGESWWFVNEPRRREPRRDELPRSDADQRAHLLGLVAGDAGPAATIIAATTQFSEPSPIHTIPHLDRWHHGRVVVIGDAAHAPSPSSGQGASLAIEDAVELAVALRDHGSATDAEVVAALDWFVARRRPRVESIIRQAARINTSKTATGPARVVRDLVLPRILRATAGSPQLRDAYEYRSPSLVP